MNNKQDYLTGRCCPDCGSTRISSFDKDNVRCEDCGAEFDRNIASFISNKHFTNNIQEKPDYLTEISGPHFDANGHYFVIRLDEGEELKASRIAINAFADNIEDREKAEDLKKRYPLI